MAGGAFAGLSGPFREGPAGVRFAVRLTPKGGRDSIDGWCLDSAGRAYLKARVAAPPEDGKANAALLALLAKALGLPKSAVTLAAGETARLKQVDVAAPRDYVEARLPKLGESPERQDH